MVITILIIFLNFPTAPTFLSPAHTLNPDAVKLVASLTNIAKTSEALEIPTVTVESSAEGSIQTQTAVAEAFDASRKTATVVAGTMYALEKTATRAAETSTPIPTPTLPSTFPSPLSYASPALMFDNKVIFSSSPLCWRQATLPLYIKEREGFFRNNDYDWWVFTTGDEQVVEASLHNCFTDQQIGAMALNALVSHLEPQKLGVAEGEFGFFLEGKTEDKIEYRREYLLWIDMGGELHLRVRENDNIRQDYNDMVSSLTVLERDGNFLGYYFKFPIQMFLEINNQGLDILYLQKATSGPVTEVDPKQMIRINDSIRPTLNNLQKIGLIGRGRDTQVRIWPLAFFEPGFSTYKEASTPTLLSTPVVVLGYGKLRDDLYPLQSPNGAKVQQVLDDGSKSDYLLYRKQVVTVIGSEFSSGGIWYKCTWKIDGNIGEGWIHEGYIEFLPPPTPTP